MEQKTGTIVEIDLEKFIGNYSQKDYLRALLVDAIAKNPKIITDLIQTYILTDLLKSDQYQNIKESVQKSIGSLTAETLQSNGTFRSSLDLAIRDAVVESKPRVLNIVSNQIGADGFKDKVSSHIAGIVKERVMNALGEVCSGCDRDYY